MAVDLEARHGIVDEEVLVILSKKLTHEWRDVGKHLTLSDFDLDELESNKNYGMLRKWKQLKGEDATYSKLTDVLEKVNRPDLVILVNKELENRSLGHPSKSYEAPSEPVAKRLKVMTASETESEENVINKPETLQLFVQELKQTYQRMVRAFRPVPYLDASVNEIFVDTRLEELEEKAHFSKKDRWRLVGYSRDAVLKNNEQRLLLFGNHGFGKSTLSLHVAYEWATAVKDSPMSEIDILLFIRLREVPNVKSIYRMIKLLLLPKGCNIKDEVIEEILRFPQLRLVLILDGLDKLSKTNKECDIYSIMKGKLFPTAKVVITTSLDHPDSSFGGKHIKRMRLAEFDESIKHSYIRKAVAPLKSEHEEDENLVKVFKENYLLGGLCHVPLFFTMFLHLLKGNPELAKQKSITPYYDCMCKFFFNRLKNIEISQMEESSNVKEDSSLCLQLGKIAFDDFDEKSPNLSWSKSHLVEILGWDGYEQYKTAGILVEDEVFHESIDDAQAFDEEPKLKVRFFDKSMQEYYAAHYLVQRIKDIHAKDISEYLKNFNPRNLQYFYLFACGLDDTVAKRLIKFLLDKYGLEQAALSIMEIEDTTKVKDCFSTIFGCPFTINTTCNSKHLQRAKIFIVATASKFKMQVPSVELVDFFGSLNVKTGKFETKEGLQLPSLCHVERLCLKDEGRVWTEEEFKRVLEYASGCDGLAELEFSGCMLPFDVYEEPNIPEASYKTLRVKWSTRNCTYVLHPRPFRWSGVPPYNVSCSLDLMSYENIESDFHLYQSDSEWQKTHISTAPETRNYVSDATLERISHKIKGDWRAIGARLQIDERSLNRITTDGNTDTPQGIMYETLKTWRNQNRTVGSAQVLETALRSNAEEDVADELNTVLIEESTPRIASSTISREGGTLQIGSPGVQLYFPPDAFQENQEEQRVQITILPHYSLDEPTTCFEDGTTVMVQLSPYNISLRNPARLRLPHCLKLKSIVNSDVRIFRSYHEAGTKPLWEDVTTSICFTLFESHCEIKLQRLSSIKYTISGNHVEAKKLKWYALGQKCEEDAKYVTVDIGYHPDLLGENEVYREKLQDKFLADSQSFFVFKEEPTYSVLSLVQVLPLWKLLPVTSISMNISRPSKLLLHKQCYSFTFKRPHSSAVLPRCVFQISGDLLRPKYRLTVNLRVHQLPVTNTKLVAVDALFSLSHKLGDVWENIGRRLHVNEKDLEELLSKDISHQLKAYLMLIKWKKRVGGTSFVEILLKVLNDEKTDLAQELSTGDIVAAPSICKKEEPRLPDVYSLNANSVVSVEGGVISIDDTDIELNILPHSFQNSYEKHKIQLRVLPNQVFEEPTNCFEARSTTIVEIRPNNLRLKRPASLFLPHCLKLKDSKRCEVRIFQSHHTKGQNPLWEDVTTTVEYSLCESWCKMKINRFGWVRYTLRGSQVKAKKLKLYALGENCDKGTNHVNVEIGYHLDLPGHENVIREKLKDKFLGDSRKFLCFKEARDDLEVKFLEANPNWNLTNLPELPRKISFANIESSVEVKQSCLFELQRDHHTSKLPQCVFEIFQGKQPVRERITITFTPSSLQPQLDERRDVSEGYLLDQLQLMESFEQEREIVTDGALLNLSHKITSEWKDIGRRLQLPEAILHDISSRQDSIQEKVYQMLLKWKQREGSSAYLDILQRVLCDALRADLAEMITD